MEYSAHFFTDLESSPFDAKEYSRLKFGSEISAKRMGYELADKFARDHIDILLNNEIIVTPSPYNEVQNAASRLTYHFINRINVILTENSGRHVQSSIVSRHFSYVNDYGFLDKEKRKALIDGDSFYLNKDFYKEKFLIFLDDVKISGVHQRKLEEVLEDNGVFNEVAFIYYAQYLGSDAKIEAELNFAGIKDLDDYTNIILKEPNFQFLVRPMKFLLSRPVSDFKNLLKRIQPSQVEELYFNCLKEGYYAIPSYQENFQEIKKTFGHK